MTYYTQFLNQIGFKATQKVIADATYFPTIGEPEAQPPDRLRRLEPGLPEPDRLLPAARRDGDPADQQRELRPGQRPADQHAGRASSARCRRPSSARSPAQWQALDEYVAKKAYVAVFGYQTFPKFTSNRINYGAAVFHPMYGWDCTLVPAEVDERRSVGRGGYVCPRPTALARSNGHRSGPSSTGTEFSSGSRRRVRATGEDDCRPASGRGKLAWRRLRRNQVALVFGGLFLLIVVLCLLAPVYSHDIAHIEPERREHHRDGQGRRQDRGHRQPDRHPDRPDMALSHYFLGADANGRDVAVRLLYGGRNSLEIGVVATLITMVIAHDPRRARRLLPRASPTASSAACST